MSAISTPAVPKAVPSAVEFSSDNSVPVLKAASRGPYQPQTGKSINPQVPVTDTGSTPPEQPHFSAYGQTVTTDTTGSKGAPSVPTDGFLFRKGPIDPHYQVAEQTRDPYAKVNAPGTYGWRTRMQAFANHIAYNQVTDTTGMKISGPQQRTSVMLNALPPIGAFGTESYTPRQMPQAVAYNRIRQVTGTDAYGTGVLNSDTLGAGQTAGGIGGNNYTPTPGPPDTNSISRPPAVAAEPTWG